VRHIHGIGVSDKRFYPVDKDGKVKLREKIGLSSNDFVIICTGELNKNKNQEQLIKSADRLIDKIPNLKILLAGNGPNEQNLLSLIDGLNLKDTVKLLGYRTDLENIIPAVDLVASFSKREGLGLNIIEGMLCGKPIVATYNRGHSELIDNNVNGFLVPIGDIEKTAETILEIYLDFDKKQKFSLNSQTKAQKYTVDFVSGELMNILFEKKE
jgi:glycosyltransferase EpsD